MMLLLPLLVFLVVSPVFAGDLVISKDPDGTTVFSNLPSQSGHGTIDHRNDNSKQETGSATPQKIKNATGRPYDYDYRRARLEEEARRAQKAYDRAKVDESYCRSRRDASASQHLKDFYQNRLDRIAQQKKELEDAEMALRHYRLKQAGER